MSEDLYKKCAEWKEEKRQLLRQEAEERSRETCSVSRLSLYESKQKEWKKQYREYRYNLDVFKHPRGRICLVRACEDCGKFFPVINENRSILGKFLYKPSQVFYWNDKICRACSANNRNFVLIEQCDGCGKYGPYKQPGVAERYDCHDHTKYDPPLLCMKCWNKWRPVWKRWRDAEKTRLQINRFKKAIYNPKVKLFQE